jgi:hypothetical protein
MVLPGPLPPAGGSRDTAGQGGRRVKASSLGASARDSVALNQLRCGRTRWIGPSAPDLKLVTGAVSPGSTSRVLNVRLRAGEGFLQPRIGKSERTAKGITGEQLRELKSHERVSEG